MAACFRSFAVLPLRAAREPTWSLQRACNTRYASIFSGIARRVRAALGGSTWSASDLEDALAVSDVPLPIAREIAKEAAASSSVEESAKSIIANRIIKAQADAWESIRRNASTPSVKSNADHFAEQKRQQAAESTSQLLATLSTAHSPAVWLIVGPNGAGKTTTIAKMAYALQQQNLRVLVGAADVYRAAAVDQLRVWCERARIDLVEGDSDSSLADHRKSAKSGRLKASEAARGAQNVARKTVERAIAEGYDVAIIDTAGRLGNRSHLTRELKDVRRAIRSVSKSAPHFTWIVLDATLGRTAAEQGALFRQIFHVDGAILAKMDSSARGGAALGLADAGVPVWLVGSGEDLGDLAPLDPHSYAAAMVGAPSHE